MFASRSIERGYGYFTLILFTMTIGPALGDLYIRTNQGGQHGLQIYIWNRNFCGGVESVGKFLRQSVILMVDIGRSTCGRIQKF